jgi:hypothetical protein
MTTVIQSILDPFEPEPGDLVINEVLFNPASGGVDYVELYNRSEKVLTLNQLQFIERDPMGNALSDLGTISGLEQLMHPGDYFVFSTDPRIVEQHYTVQNPQWLFEMKGLPNWPDDAGIVVLARDTFQIFDSLAYSADWHYDLLADDNGVSLERISIDGNSNDPANWFSAAASANFGTPTFKNSQFFAEPGLPGEISVIPEVFSPDHDGFNDQLTILLSFDDPGYSVTVQVYDARGRFIRELANNLLPGAETKLRWDGISNDGQKADPGIYVIYFKIFNPQGNTFIEKRKCVLAERR